MRRRTIAAERDGPMLRQILALRLVVHRRGLLRFALEACRRLEAPQPSGPSSLRALRFTTTIAPRSVSSRCVQPNLRQTRVTMASILRV